MMVDFCSFDTALKTIQVEDVYEEERADFFKSKNLFSSQIFLSYDISATAEISHGTMLILC